jgi:hypothetical protein
MDGTGIIGEKTEHNEESATPGLVESVSTILSQTIGKDGLG